MKKHQKQQDAEYCDATYGEHLDAPEHEQVYGNQAAQERLAGEPIDLDVIEASMSLADAFTALLTPDDQQVDVRCGVGEFVDGVIAKAGGRPIRRLSIYAHASPGSLSMGQENIDSQMDTSQMDRLRELAPLFAEGGFVEIHGCSFADGARGEELLYVLHELFGVPVTGGISPQLGVIDGFEGSTVTATEDAEGFATFIRDEHPVGDMIHGAGGAIGELLWSGAQQGLAALEAVASAGEGAFESMELPEVGDLEQWLFGA